MGYAVHDNALLVCIIDDYIIEVDSEKKMSVLCVIPYNGFRVAHKYMVDNVQQYKDRSVCDISHVQICTS